MGRTPCEDDGERTILRYHWTSPASAVVDGCNLSPSVVNSASRFPEKSPDVTRDGIIDLRVGILKVNFNVCDKMHLVVCMLYVKFNVAIIGF